MSCVSARSLAAQDVQQPLQQSGLCRSQVDSQRLSLHVVLKIDLVVL